MAAKKAKTQKASRPAKKTAAAKKSAAKQKIVAKPSVRKKVVRTQTPSRRLAWIDELSQTPLIDDHARQLESFMTAMADGRIDEKEVKNQEQRVVSLLQEIDPQLDDALHAKVTQLLCELTAYDMMQMLYAMEQARPKTVFHG